MDRPRWGGLVVFPFFVWVLTGPGGWFKNPHCIFFIIDEGGLH